MSNIKTIISILLLASMNLSSPKMEHGLDEKDVDDVLLAHFNHVTRYAHDFSDSTPGTCGLLFSIAKNLYNKELKNTDVFKSVDGLLEKGKDFNPNACQHHSGAYTWVLLRIEDEYKECNVHIPINLFNYHLQDNEKYPLLNVKYAFDAVKVNDSTCYTKHDFEEEFMRLAAIDIDAPTPRNRNKVIGNDNSKKILFKESFVDNLVDDNDPQNPMEMTKYERIKKQDLDTALIGALAEIDKAEKMKGEENVAELREKVSNIEDEIAKIPLKKVLPKSKNYAIMLNDIEKEAKKITEDESSEEDDQEDNKANNNEESPKNNNHVSDHFDNVYNFWNNVINNDDSYDDDEKEYIKPLFHDIEDDNDQDENNLKNDDENIDDQSTEERPYVNLLEDNKNQDIVKDCSDEDKLRLIDLYYAEATFANKEGYELYTENITKCIVIDENEITFKAIISLNNNNCYYGLYNDADKGILKSVEDDKVEFGLRRCQDMLAF